MTWLSQGLLSWVVMALVYYLFNYPSKEKYILA